MRSIFAAFPGLFVLATASQLAAQGPNLELSLPLECSLPDRCVVQFHVDRAPGARLEDYRCGRLVYDGHRGTDFRVLSMRDFKAGIPVLAAAPGKVAAVRDGMDDIDVGELGREKVADRAAGNVVVLSHNGGWETSYYHMRKGSIAVAPGQQVAAGTLLGLVGLSGDTNFPHLHFEVRRGPAAVVDPFDRSPASATSCGAEAKPLWTPQALGMLRYAPVVARTGFAARRLTRAEAIYERAPEAKAVGIANPLFLWMEIYGLATDDRISLQWQLPDGTWRNPSVAVWRNSLSYAFQQGELLIDPPLAPGLYSARLRVNRGTIDTPLFEQTYSIRLE